MKTTTQLVLEKASSYEILSYYLKPFHNYGLKLKQGQNFSNPFLLPQKQVTPSFNIYKNQTTNEWRYKDFSTDDEGSCFDFVMKLFNLNLFETLQKISNDLNLNLQSEKEIDLNEIFEVKKESFSYKQQAFSKMNLDYWSKYRITKDHLKLFDVISLYSFSANNKNGKPYTFRSNNTKPIFAYVQDTFIKIYKPTDKEFKFQYLGNKRTDFVFGLKQLPENGELVIITGGEKDVISLYAHGIPAISFNSETARVPQDLLTDLKKRFKNILILYDNDKTGVKQSEKLSRDHGLNRILLPSIKNGKDISDYFFAGNSINSLTLLIKEAISMDKLNSDSLEDKILITSIELMSNKPKAHRYLIEPLLPSVGTAVLAGQPDTGKSQLVRQLCIHIATGLSKFLDYQLNTIHKRALFISTEDDKQNTHFLLYHQLNGLKVEPTKDLIFMFADILSQEEVIKELDQFLFTSPCDLVVIDSFGDIFNGTDSNNNIAMRQTVQAFDRVAKKFNCLILFVHHINKSAYGQTPAQQHVQGGSGLVQKVRLVLSLSPGENETKFLSVVKGNYCPREYKEFALDLKFCEENFIFSNTGRKIPKENIGEGNSQNKEIKINKLATLAMKIFNADFINLNEFCKRHFNITSKSIATAKRDHRAMKDLEIIKKNGGKWYLADSSDNNQTSINLKLEK